MGDVIKRVYLVQSGNFRQNQNKDNNGLDKHIDWDYMGAAEFEIGTDGEFPTTSNPLCISLKRMTKYQEQYDFFTVNDIKDYSSSPLIVYCKKENIEELTPILKSLAKRKITTKRSCGFAKYVESTEKELEKYTIPNFWWDIENNYLLFFGDEKKEIILDCFSYYHNKWNEELFPKPTKKNFFARLFGK